MNTNLVPISTLFIGLNGLLAFALSYIAALQRKVRAHGNFAEYVPQGLLFLLALELMQLQAGLVWLLGVTLTVARVAHAYGVITQYGPSIGRAIGFFATWFVYIVGSVACLYYSCLSLI
jgi:uncharacterized membrane protein YecN with MAPEG domain